MWSFQKHLETVETLSRLHLSSKSLPGVLEDVEVPEKLGNSRKFHQDLTSETLSKLHLSSKSLPGVLEDVEVPAKLGNSRNPVKAPPVLQVSPWSLGGCGGS